MATLTATAAQTQTDNAPHSVFRIELLCPCDPAEDSFVRWTGRVKAESSDTALSLARQRCLAAFGLQGTDQHKIGYCDPGGLLCLALDEEGSPECDAPFKLDTRVVYGCDSAPSAAIPGHAELLRRNAEHMMAVAQQHNLSECRCAWPVTWSDWDDSMPLVDSELVVTRSQFWFAAQTKRGEIVIESEAVSSSRLPHDEAYTVILDYADLHGNMGTETWIGTVYATNPTDALDCARHNCLWDNGMQGTDPERADYANPTDLCCVAILSGKHDDIQHLVATE